MNRLVSAFLAAIIAVPVLACAASSSALAASYTVTELSVPADAGTGFANKGLVVGDGRLDAFTLTSTKKDRERVPEAFLHHQSTDGGKTWKKVDDTGWFAEYAKKYFTPASKENSAQYFNPETVSGDGKGNFYFLASTGRKIFKDANSTSDSYLKRLFRFSAGGIQEVAVLDDIPDYFSSLGLTKEGIAMHARVQGSRTKYRFRLRDPATGKVTFEHVFDGMIPWGCGGGMVYGINAASTGRVDGVETEKVGRETDKRLWLGYNMAQGKETLKMENPVDHIDMPGYEDSNIFLNSTAADGACWFAADEGLFRLEPGANSLTKIMDASQAGFANGRTFQGITAGTQKDAYAVTYYWNTNNYEDPKNGTELKLLHYTPA